MSKPVKISTVLTRAAKWIEENGWVQGSYFKYRNGRKIQFEGPFSDLIELARTKNCPACALGAIYISTNRTDPVEREEVFEPAARYAEASMGDVWPSWWNDDVDRTKDEVVQALKDAAKAARKDGK